MQDELVRCGGIYNIHLENAVVGYRGPSSRKYEAASMTFDDVGSTEDDGEPRICSSHEEDGIAAFFSSRTDTVRTSGEAGGEKFPFERSMGRGCINVVDGTEDKK